MERLHGKSRDMGTFDIGVLGLGVMGSSLAGNLIDHHYNTALFSREESERKAFRQNHPGSGYQIFDMLHEFTLSLKRPRKILLMITAGNAVDQVIASLIPLMEPDDILMDGGNSHFSDTNRRVDFLREKNIAFLGIGISGGEKGARTGPSMMVGGDQKSWFVCSELLQSIAARADGQPCCNYVGQHGAGHYVKMVHNGIEYGILQLIAEAYSFLRQALGMSTGQAAVVFKDWKDSELASYLIDTAAVVLEKKDDDGQSLVDKIKDVAAQKGTGQWTLKDAVERGVYVPVIYEAVGVRSFSENRMQIPNSSSHAPESPDAALLDSLKQALYLAILCCYDQGLTLIRSASGDLPAPIHLADTVALWKAGCIIRSEVLVNIESVLRVQPAQCILDSAEFQNHPVLAAALRDIVIKSVRHEVSVPALCASLSYYDALRTDVLPVSLIQGMRDCFGAHTYERTDREGVFHTQWEEDR